MTKFNLFSPQCFVQLSLSHLNPWHTDFSLYSEDNLTSYFIEEVDDSTFILELLFSSIVTNLPGSTLRTLPQGARITPFPGRLIFSSLRTIHFLPKCVCILKCCPSTDSSPITSKYICLSHITNKNRDKTTYDQSNRKQNTPALNPALSSICDSTSLDFPKEKSTVSYFFIVHSLLNLPDHEALSPSVERGPHLFLHHRVVWHLHKLIP